MNDTWSSGNGYDSYIGRWSKLVAREFLEWMNIPSGKKWLDVGCGAGALSETILHQCSPLSIESIDASEGYISYARSALKEARIQFHIADAQNLPFEQQSFDVVASGLVLNFVPDPSKALQEMKRVLTKNGIIGIYLWDYAGKMELLRYFWDAAIALDPAALSLDEGKRFPLCDLSAGGRGRLHGGVVREIDWQAGRLPRHARPRRDQRSHWRASLAGFSGAGKGLTEPA